MRFLFILFLVLNSTMIYPNIDSFCEKDVIEITSSPQSFTKSISQQKIKIVTQPSHSIKAKIDSPSSKLIDLQNQQTIDSIMNQGEWLTSTKTLNNNVTGFILGLLASFTFLLPPISLILGILGLHFSKKNLENSSKIKLAKTGKVLSIIAISLAAATLCGYLFSFLKFL